MTSPQLNKLVLIVGMAIMLPFCTVAQFAPEHAAMNSMKKGKWDKARDQLAKAVRKDSLNAVAHYGLAMYFFTPSNPAYQIDSAYQYTMHALADYQRATVKQRDRLRKIPLDSMLLVNYRQRIDSAAFERAKAKNTEISYIDFIKQFPFATQQPQAIELRDEVAYLNALKENTYLAFQKYLEKYPESLRFSEAKTRYEKLLFEFKTKDKKLASYEAFLHDYPATPHRPEVEKQIFEISTASGESDEFVKFLKRHPESGRAKIANNILYHLLKEEDRASGMIPGDSIKKLIVLEKDVFIPFLKNDHFGFMNEEGRETLKPVFNEILDEYRCGDISDELLILDHKVLARNGEPVYDGEIDAWDKLGSGFIKVIKSKCVKIIHVSGYAPWQGCFQDAKLLGKNYLALQRDSKWSVWTFTGRMLVEFSWDDIQQVGDAVVFKKSGKYKLARLKDLSKPADQETISFSADYDEVKSWPDKMFWVRIGKEQGVLNQNLKEWIKPSLQEITPTFFGAVSRTSLGYKLYDRLSAPSQNFVQVNVNKPWVGVQQNGYWNLIDPTSKQVWSPSFDSVLFRGPFSVGIKHDSLRIYLTRENFIDLQNSKVQFLPGRDSLYFLEVDEADKKKIYDTKGQLLFVTTFDKVEYNNEGFFTIFKKDKRGLINLQGKLIVQPEYDALGAVNKGIVQVLRDKKFGLLDVIHRKEIKTEYDKNITAYNGKVNVVYKGGLCGLIGWDNKPVTPFEFEEIVFWNDSSAFVRKNFNWIIYNFIEKKVVMDMIKTFKRVLDTEQEKVMIVQQENKYGVISNRKGVIIPTTFTDIVNVGSSASPVYFTEKHVEEASLFVVIYYDRNGVQLRRQVYEVDDYEKIYCSGN